MVFLCYYVRFLKGFEVYFFNVNGRVWYKLGREFGFLLKREKWNKVVKWNIWIFINGYFVFLRGLILKLFRWFEEEEEEIWESCICN